MLKFNKHLIKSISNQAKQSYASHETHTVKLPSKPADLENARLTKFIESKDEFKYVLNLLPKQVVPDPPKHESYPTPSGWVPVDPLKALQHPYYLNRTRFHNLPIYVDEREGGSRKLIRIKYIEGDIWKFNNDLKNFIEENYTKDNDIKHKKWTICTSVNEIQRQILVKGLYHDYVCKFCLEKGF